MWAATVCPASCSRLTSSRDIQFGLPNGTVMTKNVARIARRASSGTPVVIWLPCESSKLSSTGFGGSGAPVVRWATCSSGEIVV